MPYNRNEIDEYFGMFLYESGLAILVDFDGDGDGVWLPKSKVEYEDDVYERGDLITVAVPLWLAEDKGLV